MNEAVDAAVLYPDNRLFLDFIAGRASATGFFEHAPAGFSNAADARGSIAYPRTALVDALLAYNARLGAGQSAVANIEALGDTSTLCVLAGQQAGFLGGPAYTAFKALHAARFAKWLEERLERRVVPVFWLASDDHDFTEVNRVRLLEGGELRNVSFDWSDRGHPIEALPRTSAVQEAADAVLDRLPPARGNVRALFLPEETDDYALWHARIWSRLFERQGLILVEPRVLRHLAGDFFRRALSLSPKITDQLRQVAGDLRRTGYEARLDPERAGRLFVIAENGRRARPEPRGGPTVDPHRDPHAYSPDAALRPLLADTLFPTIASLLGPGEIAYQAMLNPLYKLFDLPQPVIAPRHGYTLLSEEETALLARLGVSAAKALSVGFDPAAIAQEKASPDLRAAFRATRKAVEKAFAPLRPELRGIDPSLDARWRQSSDHTGQAIAKLEERAVRADLARKGLSIPQLHFLAFTLRPTGELQERVLSFVHFAMKFGVEWLTDLERTGSPERFEHRVLTIRGDR